MNFTLIRILDVLFSMLLIIISFPFMLILMVLIILFIDYPPFYISKRIGKNGIPFTHLKFRSMLKGKEVGS